jgi:hypothetical protein
VLLGKPIRRENGQIGGIDRILLRPAKFGINVIEALEQIVAVVNNGASVSGSQFPCSTSPKGKTGNQQLVSRLEEVQYGGNALHDGSLFAGTETPVVKYRLIRQVYVKLNDAGSE